MTDREKLVGLINKGVEIHTDGYQRKIAAAETIADHLIDNGVTVQQTKKAENCRYYTPNSFCGAGCLGSKEVDPCEGDKCERWEPKEES